MNERVIIHRRVNAIETLKYPHEKTNTRELITITFIRILMIDYCPFYSIKLIDRRSTSMRSRRNCWIYLIEKDESISISKCKRRKGMIRQWIFFCEKKINIDVILKVETKIPKEIFGQYFRIWKKISKKDILKFETKFKNPWSTFKI